MGGSQSTPRRRTSEGQSRAMDPARNRPHPSHSPHTTIERTDDTPSASTSSSSSTAAMPSRRRPRPPSFGTQSASPSPEPEQQPTRSRTRSYGRKMLTALRAAGGGSDTQLATRKEVVSETASEKKRRRTGSRARSEGVVGGPGAMTSRSEPVAQQVVESPSISEAQQTEPVDTVMEVDAAAPAAGQHHDKHAHEIALGEPIAAIQAEQEQKPDEPMPDAHSPHIPTSITLPAPTETLPAAALSPSIVPLTTTNDPLLDDRLRMLSTIRNVLGEDVVRSLPAVREGSLRRLSAEGVGLDAIGLGGLTGSPPPEAAPGGGDRVDTPISFVTAPSDTPVVTEGQTEAATGPSQGQANSTTSASTLNPSNHSANSASVNPPAAMPPSALPRSRSQLRNVAGRLSGWFGRADSSERTASIHSAQSSSSGPVPLMPPAPASQAPTAAASSSDAAGSAPADASRAGQLQHVQQGPMMVVQGYVQTSSPPAGAAGPDADAGSAYANGAAGQAPGVSPSPLLDEAMMQAEPSSSTAHQASPAAAGTASAAGSFPQSTTPLGSPPTTASTDRSFRRPTLFHRRRGDNPPPSFQDQARMLGGLLSVATAATASSLLAANSAMDAETLSSRLSEQPRRPLDTLRNRLRARAGLGTRDRLERGVEEVLREYMQNALTTPVSGANSTPSTFALPSSGTHENAPTGSDPVINSSPSAEQAPGDESSEAAATFDRFLDSMQTDLMSAMTAYAHRLEQGVQVGSTGQRPAAVSASSTSDAPSREVSSASAAAEAPAVESSAIATAVLEEATADLGSTSPAAEQSGSAPPMLASPPTDVPAVTGPPGEGRSDIRDGRLSFFRVFQFETRVVPPTNTADVNGPPLIPAVIIGVRSVSGDANNAEMGAAGILDDRPPVQDAPNAAPSTATSNPALTTPPISAAPDVLTAGSEAPSNRSNWASRLTRSIDRLRSGRQRPTPPDNVSNYVLWVVGGHWPAGHPVIRLPNLVTGQLDYDDIWILAEALGQIKPPTATKEDIAKSGLAIIKAASIPRALESGDILSNTAERCLICLGDYEPDEDCRVMGCKHCFHVGCVDRWLETGRNSCPACRQAGVQTEATTTEADPSSILNASPATQ